MPKKKKKQDDQNVKDLKNILIIKEQFKKDVFDYLKRTYNLFEVEPQYIFESQYCLASERLINYDNVIDGIVYSFNNYMDLGILKHMMLLNIELQQGIICQYHKFLRDFNQSQLNNHTELHIIFEHKIRLEDATYVYLGELVKSIFKNINNILDNYIHENNFMQKFSRTIRITNVDEIIKAYPWLKFNDALNQEVYNSHSVLIFGTNGKNKKNINLLTNKTQIYNDKIYASLYLNHEPSQKILNIGSVNICPNSKDLKSFIKDYNVADSTFANLINYAPENDNYLVVDLNLTKIFLYIFNLENISELL